MLLHLGLFTFLSQLPTHCANSCPFFLQALFVEDASLAASKLAAESLRDRLMIAFSRLNTICTEAHATSKLASAAAAAAAKPVASKVSPLGAAEADPFATAGTGYSEKKSPLGSKTDLPALESELSFTVPIGELGIGLVIVHDSTSSYVVIKGFRAMPYNKENTAQAAGLRVNDRIKSINGSTLQDHNHAVNLIRSAVGEIRLVVVRK